MVFLADVLKRDSEPLPDWLCSESPSFSRNDFFGSRTLYYPGSGYDEQPVSLCTRAHAVHAFVYVDYLVEQEEIIGWAPNAWEGYTVEYTETVAEDTLWPGGFAQHVSSLDLLDKSNGFASAKPFVLFVVLSRNNDTGYDETHGPERFAVLFIGRDGFATFDALYCQGDGTAVPFLVVIQDHGFGGNWDKFGFGQGGILESIAKKCNQRPRWLLFGEGGESEPWKGYNDVGAAPELGGQHEIQTPRSLYMFDNGEQQL